MKNIFKGLGMVLMALTLVVVLMPASAGATLTLSSVAVDSATGDALTIGASNVGGTITIGAANTGGIIIGGGTAAKTITIGSTSTGAETITIGNASAASGTNSLNGYNVAVAQAATTGTLTVGAAAATGAVAYNGAVTGGANTLFGNATTSTVAIGGTAMTTGTTTIYGGSTATDGKVIFTTPTGAMAGGNTYSSSPLVLMEQNTNDTTAGLRQGILSVGIYRPSTNALVTWDGNKDIGMKINAYNEAANGTNGGVEGLEILARNTGTGATNSLVKGMNVTAENKTGAGTVQDTLTAMFTMKNNGVVATSNHGVEILDESQGTNPTDTVMLKLNTTAAATGATRTGIEFANAGTGYDYAIDMNGTTIGTAAIRLQNGETINNATDGTIAVGGKLLVNGVRVANASTAANLNEQFLTVTGSITGIGSLGVDGLAGGGDDKNAKTYLLQVSGTREAATDVLIGDFDDAAIKASITNKSAGNAAGYVLRGLDVGATNRDGGSVTNLYGGNISATQKGSSAVTTNLWGLNVKVEADSPNTAATNVIGLNVEYDMVAPTGTPTISAGVRVNQNSDYYSAYPLAGFMVDNGATNRPWQYGLYIDDTTTLTADIRLSSGATLGTGTALPATCVKGSLFTDTTTAKLHMCTATNVWSTGSQL